MHADKAFRPVGVRRQSSNGDRGGITGDQRGFAQMWDQRLEYLPLNRFVLGRGFDDEVAFSKIRVVEGRRNAIERS